MRKLLDKALLVPRAGGVQLHRCHNDQDTLLGPVLSFGFKDACRAAQWVNKLADHVFHSSGYGFLSLSAAAVTFQSSPQPRL